MRSKKAKDPTLKTKRLLLRPMTDEELCALIARTDDAELREAYEEMSAACAAHSETRIWHTTWSMTRKSDGAYIGEFGFKGAPRDNAVEIGYSVLREFEGQGYATEAVQAATAWAFEQENVVFVEAETAPGNAASQRVLEKCGFVPDGTGEEGPRFVLESTTPSWTAIFLCLGVGCFGCPLFAASDNVALGMSLGAGVGLCIGAALDARAKAERAAIKEKRKKIV